MNAKVYHWLGIGSAFAIGVIAGVAGVRTELEIKLRKEYAEREAMMQNAYEEALAMGLAEKEQPTRTIDDIELLELSLDATPNAFGEGILTVGGDIVREGEPEATVNPYHRAVEATPTDIDAFVEGAISEQGISYIDEEDYLDDEDGRAKSKIDLIINGDDPPLFLEDGIPIDDWAEKVGESIVVDFYKLVPPGIDPILYVRNHRTDEDYEVVRVTP